MRKGINFKDQSQVLHIDSFVNKVDNANWPQKVYGQLSYNEDVVDLVFYWLFILFMLHKFKHCYCIFVRIYLNPLMQENKKAKDLTALDPFLPHPEHSYFPSCSPYISYDIDKNGFWE